MIRRPPRSTLFPTRRSSDLATVEDMTRFREANPHARPGQVQAASTANDLSYHGGIGGIGVETAPRIYLVLWGSQWNNNDPSGEAAILENFYRGVGGSSWANSVTQYCQGVPSGTVSDRKSVV